MLQIANIYGFIVAHRFTILRLLALLFLIGAVLWTMDYCTGFWSERGINKHKANVNEAMEAVNAAKSDLTNNKINEAIAIEKVAEAANEAIRASNATDEAKTAANVALQRYENAKRANAPIGTSEQELLDALNKLDQ